MVSQEILDTFVYQTNNGRFGVSDPTEFDQVIGYYNTKIEAENALKEFITREKIEFE
jgi:hypothetical protein